jgi:serine acetyltransferase
VSISEADVRHDPLSAVNRFLCWVFRRGRQRVLKRLVSLFFHVELPDLDHPVRLPYPHGVVVNGGVTLGRNVTLYQGVTLGTKRHGRHAGAPVLGDDVCVFPNAVIVGAVTIGAGAVIGPCSVVIEDVPAGAVFAGYVARALVNARPPQ